MTTIRNWLVPADLSAWRYGLRLTVVVAQFLIAYCLAGQNSPFFYQAF